MIDPVAFQFFSFKIYWYAIIINIAFIAGIIMACYLARKEGFPTDHILNLVIVIIPAAIIGARIYYVLFNWTYYSLNPGEIAAIWHGGLAIHGGLLGGTLAALVYIRKKGLFPGQIADLMAPGVILGQAVGRWGNFINQEAHGGPASAEFMSRFPSFISEQMYIEGQYYHPTFLYESGWNLLVFIILMVFRSRRRFSGEVALWYLALYSLGRFFIEAMRTDSLMIGTLKTAQLVSIGLILISSAIVVYTRCRKPKNTLP